MRRRDAMSYMRTRSKAWSFCSCTCWESGDQKHVNGVANLQNPTERLQFIVVEMEHIHCILTKDVAHAMDKKRPVELVLEPPKMRVKNLPSRMPELTIHCTNIILKTAFFRKDGVRIDCSRGVYFKRHRAHTDSYLWNTPRLRNDFWYLLWYHLSCQAPVWPQTTPCCWDQGVQVDRNCRNMRGAVRERELSQCLLLTPSLNICVEWLPHLYYADVFQRMCSTMA